MKLELIPLLQIQRDLCDLPRGWSRFEEYLRVMTGGTDDMVLPLALFNPMSKPHVAELLDALLDLGAEKVAAEALEDAERRLPEVDGSLQVGLVIVDDAQGGWTNRYLTDSTHRFGGNGELKRNWVTVLLWSGEPLSKEKVREETLKNVYRTLYVMRNGWPKTLRRMMAQEGFAAVFAGADRPSLTTEEFTCAREVIQPHLDSTHFPSVFACLYGDEAAASVGYDPLGLPPWSGYAVALAEARDGGASPEAAFSSSQGTTVSSFLDSDTKTS